jgi:hypothetical protein
MEENFENVDLLHSECLHGEEEEEPEFEDIKEDTPEENKEDIAEKERVILSRLRRDLGHCHNRVMAKMLKATGAANNLVRAALNFKSQACDMVKLPKASGKASGRDIPPALENIAADGLGW